MSDQVGAQLQKLYCQLFLSSICAAAWWGPKLAANAQGKQALCIKKGNVHHAQQGCGCLYRARVGRFRVLSKLQPSPRGGQLGESRSSSTLAPLKAQRPQAYS